MFWALKIERKYRNKIGNNIEKERLEGEIQIFLGHIFKQGDAMISVLAHNFREKFLTINTSRHPFEMEK